MAVEIDYLNPDYTAILADRSRKLAKLRKDPKLLQACKIHYASNPADFINDWGMTYDPRNVERGMLPTMPFVLWPKQREYLEWLYQQWRSGEFGLVEKSRDCGVSWLSVGFSVNMWLFCPGFAAGFGSRKEELVDKKGDPKSLFEKIRPFIRLLPVEFRPKGYDEREHGTYMRVVNPENGATIVGESGDNIGRGGRCSIYFVDEAAFVQNQESVDAALSQNTNCQIDISTPNGSGNAFYKKRHSGKVEVFVFDWSDDPRKNQEWYDKAVARLDPIIVAQEIDRDYNASAENIFIPAKWVNAAVDAHEKLGWEASGVHVVSFDPADTGDAKARGYRHGSVLVDCDEMIQGDIRDAVPWVRDYTLTLQDVDTFVYDADGMGAPIVKLAMEDEFEGKGLTVEDFRGSGEIEDPEDDIPELGKTNKDAFVNFRAQSAYRLRRRFERTYEAVEKGVYHNPDEMISISSKCAKLDNLKAELSRPQRVYTGNGKIMVEAKAAMKKRGVASPNQFDMCSMAFSVSKPKQRKPVRLNFVSEFSTSS